MRVVVTGASGFVGSAAAAALAAAGWQVTGTGRRPRPIVLDERVDYHRWDVTDGAGAAPPVPADVVLHCACAVDDWQPYRAQAAVTVAGTLAALAAWPDARFIQMSSASVYPAWLPGVVAEGDGPAASWVGAYPRAKAEAEEVVASAGRSGRSTLILRPHAVYGPGDPTLLPRLVAAVRGGRLVVPGSARTLVHLTSVRTLASVCVGACDGDLRGVVNVADARPLPLGVALDAALTAALGRAPRRHHLPLAAARPLGCVLELAARLGRRTHPPVLTRYLVSQLAVSRELDLTRLRSHLGIDPPETDLAVLQRS